MKLNEIITTILLLAIIFIIVLFGLVFLTDFLENQDSSPQDTVVKQDTLPQTADDIRIAKWPTLLPSNQTDSLKQKDANSLLSKKELEDLRVFVLEFLKSYETFNPDRTALAKANNRPDPYTALLGPFVSSGSVEKIISRSETNDLPGVCPFAEGQCVNGMNWVGGSAPDVKFIKDGVAYVTVNGIVEYTSSDEFNSLKGRRGMKEYAVILLSDGGKWKVSRAISSIGQEVSI